MQPASSLGELLRIGDLEIRPREGLALAGGRALRLSVREFTLLTVLASHAGRIVTREELYDEVWGGALRRGDRCVDVYVHKLRVKLANAMPGVEAIHTHVGFGYRLDSMPSHSFHMDATDL